MPKLTTTTQDFYRDASFVDPDALMLAQGKDGEALAAKVKDFRQSSLGQDKQSITLSALTSPIDLPNEVIEHVIDAIAKSKRILSLPFDWDEAGSPPYKETTWEKAKRFVLANAQSLWLQNKVRMDTPKILPGPDGSIDIHWKTDRRELLINIPENLGESASYYGDNKLGQIVKGTLDTTKDCRWLWMWLMQ